MSTIFPGILAALFTAGIAYGTAQLMSVHSWFNLIGVGGTIGLVYTLTVYFLILNKRDRRLLVTLLPLEKLEHSLSLVGGR